MALTFPKVEKILERATIVAALVVSLVLTFGYRASVENLRSALASSCSQKAEFHSASHAAIGASIGYYRTQLRLLNDNYDNQLKIISSYPRAAQKQAIARVNQNRRSLSFVLSKDEAAFNAGVNISCPH